MCYPCFLWVKHPRVVADVAVVDDAAVTVDTVTRSTHTGYTPTHTIQLLGEAERPTHHLSSLTPVDQ